MRLKGGVETVVLNNTSSEDACHVLGLPAVWSHITQSLGLCCQAGAVLAGSEGGTGPTPKESHKLHLLFSCILLVLYKGCTPLRGIVREHLGNKRTILIAMLIEYLTGKEGCGPGMPDILTSCNRYRKKNWLWLWNVPEDIHVDEKPIYNYRCLAPVPVTQINTTHFLSFPGM